MTNIFTKNRFRTGLVILLVIGLAACKKSTTEQAVDTGTTNVPTGATRTQLTLDSMYLYAKQIYFWNDALPEYSVFNPRQYSSKSSAIDNYEDELYAISQLKINPATGQAYEYYGDGFPKYSFINDITLNNPSATASLKDQADVDTEGNGNDIGIRPVFYLSRTNTSYNLMVTAVYPGSPAAAAGVTRGYWIQKINGTEVGKNYSTERAGVLSTLDASSVKLEGVNAADGKTFSVTLTKSAYKSSPVYTSKVITRAGKKIGYLAFARFSVLSNQDDLAPSDLNLDPVFAQFSTQGVTDLVIDLRYNGGGYVNTCEYLSNLIAPSSLTGKKMFTEIYNTTMQTKKATLLANQPLLDGDGKIQRNKNTNAIITYADLDYSSTAAGNNVSFNKKGNLNTVTNVVFIVSGSTASASELLINNLKPYLKVQLVGQTTYGKPVGFFPITLENRYEVYMPLFETRNANNEGSYYAGMTAGTSFTDGSQYPFGEEKEPGLAASLLLIAPGSASSQAATSSVNSRSVKVPTFDFSEAKPVNPNSEFNGMIDRKRK